MSFANLKKIAFLDQLHIFYTVIYTGGPNYFQNLFLTILYYRTYQESQGIKNRSWCKLWKLINVGFLEPPPKTHTSLGWPAKTYIHQFSAGS